MTKQHSADLRGEQTVATNQWLVIGASSLGTVFEWYDFYLYGLLASIITAQFFSGVNEVTGFIFALAAFAAGFAVRPFGALAFGSGIRSWWPAPCWSWGCSSCPRRSIARSTNESLRYIRFTELAHGQNVTLYGSGAAYFTYAAA
jgi:hypothetical protein